MVNPRKTYNLPINLKYDWLMFKIDGLLFRNHIKVGNRLYQMEGVLIDVA
jgi:hypothetical protein